MCETLFAALQMCLMAEGAQAQVVNQKDAAVATAEAELQAALALYDQRKQETIVARDAWEACIGGGGGGNNGDNEPMQESRPAAARGRRRPRR